MKSVSIELADKSYSLPPKKALALLIVEGVNITREAEYKDMRCTNDPLDSALAVIRRFKMWREATKRFVEQLKLDIEDSSLFYEADGAPYISGHPELSFFESAEAKNTILTVQKAAQNKLEKLRKLQNKLFGNSSLPTKKGNAIVVKVDQGYRILGKMVYFDSISENYTKIFDIIIDGKDDTGFISYREIIDNMERKGFPINQKDIYNAIQNKRQGILKTLIDKEIDIDWIRPVRAKGIRLQVVDKK